MKIITLEEKEFDKYALKHKYRSYYQSSSYGKIMKKFGYDIHYLGIIDEMENLIGASLLLYKEVFIKDIVERNRIEKENVLEDILNYLSSQIGLLTNPTKVANALSNARKEKIDSNLVSSYINHSIDAFLISMSKRYDIRGKSYFNYPNKYYFTDLGLRNARLNFRQYDPGHLMENAIYNELIKRGYSVDVGVVVDRRNGANSLKEIDFVVNEGARRIYIQSVLRLDDEEKIKSELDSFKLTNDFFKKIIIRNDITHNYYDENGIYHCCLSDFLLNRTQLF